MPYFHFKHNFFDFFFFFYLSVVTEWRNQDKSEQFLKNYYFKEPLLATFRQEKIKHLTKLSFGLSYLCHQKFIYVASVSLTHLIQSTVTNWILK